MVGISLNRTKINKKLRSLFKIIFGRTMIVVLGLAMQIAVIVVAMKFFSDHFMYFSIVSAILSTIVIVWIINDSTNPYYKLSWIVPVTLVPVFGTVTYLFAKLELGTRIMNERILRLIDETSPLIPQDKQTIGELEEISVKEKNLAEYMKKYAGYPIWKNTYAEYYPLGEDAFASMVRELEAAEKFIFMEYFIVERGEMWDTILEILVRKAKDGVDVRFMYDGMCSLLLVPYSYPKKLEALGVKCKMFSPIKPVLSTVQNNRDHRKILVIDGHTAYTGGVNLADEYINRTERFGHWKDTAVMIKGEAVSSFTIMFLQNWNITEYSGEDRYEDFILTDFSELREKNLCADGFVLPYGDSPLDNENVGQTVYLDIINRAERYVHIMTPYLILDNEMTGALTYAAKRGVDVTIIMPHVPDKIYAYLLARSYYAELIGAGVKIFEYVPGFVHAKGFVSDDTKAVVGSINLDYRSLFLHFECACYFYRHPVVAQVEDDMRETLKKCIQITLEDCKRYGLLKRLAGHLLRLFAPLM